MTPCYPPDDPRFIDPKLLESATLDQKLAYRKVVEEKRKNDIQEAFKLLKEKEIKDRWKSYFLLFFGTVAASCIGASVMVWQEFRKDDKFENVHKILKRIEENDCSKELAQQRLFYDSGELGKVKDYARRIWSELHMQGIISESNENVVD